MPTLTEGDLIKVLGCTKEKNLMDEDIIVFRNVFAIPASKKEKDEKRTFHYARLLRPANEASRVSTYKNEANEIQYHQPGWGKPTYPEPKEVERFSKKAVCSVNRPAALMLIGPESEKHDIRTALKGYFLPGTVNMINETLGTSLLLDRSHHPDEVLLNGLIDKVTMADAEAQELLPKATRERLHVLVIPVILLEFTTTPKEEYHEHIWNWPPCGNGGMDHLWDTRKEIKDPKKLEEWEIFARLSDRFGMQASWYDLYMSCSFIYRDIVDDDSEPTYLLKGNKKVRLPPKETESTILAWVKKEGTDNTILLHEKDGRLIGHPLYSQSHSGRGSDFYSPRTHLQGGDHRCDIYY